MELPKPEKREKRAPKPLKRTRPRRRRKGKKAGMVWAADRLWARIVKHDKHCWFVGSILGRRDHVCVGPLQAMHGIPRSYRGTRWLPINGFAGCAAAHMYFTHRPEEWAAYLLDAWGPEVFRELWHSAHSHDKLDLEAILESLRCELFKLEGIPPLDQK